MKRILIFMIVLLSGTIVFGQEGKKKVAIYTDDKSGKNYVEFAGEFLTNAIVKRNDYEAYERTKDFLQLISKEQEYQRSGAVSEDQIASLGKQLGVQLVCAVIIGVADGQYFISAKLIDVETAGIESSSRPQLFSAGDYAGFEKACEEVAASLFGASSSASDNISGNIQRRLAEPEMVFVQGGTFWMGCSDEQGSDCYNDEKPLYSVTLNNFYIGKYEVTQAQWEAVMEDNPSANMGHDLPVENVSWEEVQKFIRKLNAMTGKNYRLPTEAEWEYAARGGNQSRGYKYSGSNNVDEVAWYENNSEEKTHQVGTKKANELGIYDMSGNVFECCQDWYDNKYYKKKYQMNPSGASSGILRVNRGGSWNNRARSCRAANRSFNPPYNRDSDLGFRLANSAK
jgi:formylglycine-generating enzyme required for sulfatase activity